MIGWKDNTLLGTIEAVDLEEAIPVIAKNQGSTPKKFVSCWRLAKRFIQWVASIASNTPSHFWPNTRKMVKGEQYGMHPP
jgi:hypothetical protein